MIKFTNITKRYDGIVALDNVNFELPNTGLILIQGPNGSGKSTIMNLIGALDKPILGTITVDDLVITSLSEEELTAYREENVSFIFQYGNLFENMTVEENICLTGKSPHMEKIVDLLNLKDLLPKKASVLSGGEKARVGIARAVLKDAKIVLADEPTAAIDVDSKQIIYRLLKKLSETRLVIIVSHDDERIDLDEDVLITVEEGHIATLEHKRETSIIPDIPPYENTFDLVAFTKKNLYSNHKKMARSAVLLLLSFFTILLATSMARLDFAEMQADTMLLERDTHIYLNNYEYISFGDYHKRAPFEKKDLEELRTDFHGELLVGKKINIENEYIHLDLDYKEEPRSSYYRFQVRENTFYPITDSTEIVYGSFPKAANEIVVNLYLAELMIHTGVKDMSGNYYLPSSLQDLVSSKRELNLAGRAVVIAGISNMDLAKYSSLKDTFNLYLHDVMDQYLENTSDHIYVTEEFFTLFEDYKPSIDERYIVTSDPGYKDGNIYHPGKDLEFTPFKEPVILKRTYEVVDHLEPNEIIVNGLILDILRLGPDEIIGKTIELYFEDTEDMTVSDPIEFTIVGISADNNNYLNLEVAKDYLVSPFSTEVVEYVAKDKNEITHILTKYRNPEDGFTSTTTYRPSFDSIETECLAITVLATILSIVFTLLGFLFLLNYAFSSIEEHQRHIAILTSLGIKRKTIFRMFALEMMSISLKSYIFALAAFILTRPIVNELARYLLAFKVDLLPIDILAILLTLVLILIIGTLITSFAFKKMKKFTPQEILNADL